jgi:threonine synthase
MNPMEAFLCAFCQKTYPADPFRTFCPECQEPLLCQSPRKTKKFYPGRSHPLEVMLDFLPLHQANQDLSLGEGNTPLIRLKNVEKKYRLPPLYAKNETVNPTLSFKDRGTAVAIQKAVSLGLDKIGTVSTGNMAVSTAAYGARAGLKTCVMIKEGAHKETLRSIGVYNPLMINVRGDYGELFRKSVLLGRENQIYFANSVDPYRIEGYKITAFEIFFQLKQRAPDIIIVPASSGGHLIGIIKAFEELKQQGFITMHPYYVGVQAEGCSPIAQAFQVKKAHVERIAKAETIAKAISNPDPPGGNLLMRMIRETGGTVIGIPDDKIREAQQTLAEIEGIFVQPASATALAGVLELTEKEKIEPESRIVLILTGSGIKASVTAGHSDMRVMQATLDDLPRIFHSFESD